MAGLRSKLHSLDLTVSISRTFSSFSSLMSAIPTTAISIYQNTPKLKSSITHRSSSLKIANTATLSRPSHAVIQASMLLSNRWRTTHTRCMSRPTQRRSTRQPSLFLPSMDLTQKKKFPPFGPLSRQQLTFFSNLGRWLLRRMPTSHGEKSTEKDPFFRKKRGPDR